MKKTDFTIDNNGRAIPVTEYICDEGAVTVALHGFGGDRSSSVIRRLAEKSGNVVCFDFPAHGESTAPDCALTVENCISDFGAVLSYVRSKYRGREVRFFATSFGGYVLLLSLHLINDREKIVLRAPAVKMGEIFLNVIAQMSEEELLEKGSVICGFERKINVSYEYYEGLKRCDAMSAPDTPMLIIHGDCDNVVLPSQIDSFCRCRPSAVLYRIEGADHRFKGSGQVDDVVDTAARWFGGGSIVKKH